MPRVAQPRGDRQHAIDQHRRQPGGRLVQHQQARAAHQPLRHRQHLLLAAGERAAAIVPLGGDLGEQRQRLLDARGALAARQVVAGQQQVVGDGQLREHAVALDHVRQPGAHGRARAGAAQIVAGERDRAGGHGSRPETARSSVVLPAPLGPSSATISPAPIAQVDAVQHADLAVAGGQPCDVQQRLRRRDRH